MPTVGANQSGTAEVHWMQNTQNPGHLMKTNQVIKNFSGFLCGAPPKKSLEIQNVLSLVTPSNSVWVSIVLVKNAAEVRGASAEKLPREKPASNKGRLSKHGLQRLSLFP